MQIYILFSNGKESGRKVMQDHPKSSFVVKEAVQVLSTAMRLLGYTENEIPGLYKAYPSVKHPNACAKWLLESRKNFDWLFGYIEGALTFYPKGHKSGLIYHQIKQVKIPTHWTDSTGKQVEIPETSEITQTLFNISPKNTEFFVDSSFGDVFQRYQELLRRKRKALSPVKRKAEPVSYIDLTEETLVTSKYFKPNLTYTPCPEILVNFKAQRIKSA